MEEAETRPTSEAAVPLPSSTNKCAGILTRMSPRFVFFRLLIALRPSASALPTSNSTYIQYNHSFTGRGHSTRCGPETVMRDSMMIVLYALGLRVALYRGASRTDRIRGLKSYQASLVPYPGCKICLMVMASA